MQRRLTQQERTQAFLMMLPKRLLNPLLRTQMYIEFRAGAPDPARNARLERMRQLARRR